MELRGIYLCTFSNIQSFSDQQWHCGEFSAVIGSAQVFRQQMTVKTDIWSAIALA
jgi:hypothetical protein